MESLSWSTIGFRVSVLTLAAKKGDVETFAIIKGLILAQVVAAGVKPGDFAVVQPQDPIFKIEDPQDCAREVTNLLGESMEAPDAIF